MFDKNIKKWALITGASSGIGREIALELARKKRDLILVARSQNKLKDLAQNIKEKYNVEVKVYKADLSKKEDRDDLISNIRNEFIEVLVNNAGVGVYGPFVDTELENENSMIQLNILALTQLTKAVLPQMIQNKSGKILNIASLAAFQPGPLMAVYYATKAYVLSFSEAVAKELENTGVTVTAFCPGATESGFQKAAQAENSKLFNKKLPSAKTIALEGLLALKKGKRVAIPGTRNWLTAQSVRFMPRNTVLSVVKKIQESS